MLTLMAVLVLTVVALSQVKIHQKLTVLRLITVVTLLRTSLLLT